MQERVERVNAQKSLILKETETYYTKGTLKPGFHLVVAVAGVFL